MLIPKCMLILLLLDRSRNARCIDVCRRRRWVRQVRGRCVRGGSKGRLPTECGLIRGGRGVSRQSLGVVVVVGVHQVAQSVALLRRGTSASSFYSAFSGPPAREFSAADTGKAHDGDVWRPSLCAERCAPLAPRPRDRDQLRRHRRLCRGWLRPRALQRGRRPAQPPRRVRWCSAPRCKGQTRSSPPSCNHRGHIVCRRARWLGGHRLHRRHSRAWSCAVSRRGC